MPRELESSISLRNSFWNVFIRPWGAVWNPSRQLGETPVISKWVFLIQDIIILSCGILGLEGLIFLLSRGLSWYRMNNFLSRGRGGMGYFVWFKNCLTGKEHINKWIVWNALCLFQLSCGFRKAQPLPRKLWRALSLQMLEELCTPSGINGGDCLFSFHRDRHMKGGFLRALWSPCL